MTITSSPSPALRSSDFPSREERSRRTAELLARRAATDSLDEQRSLTAEIVEVKGVPLYTDARHYSARGIPTVLVPPSPGIASAIGLPVGDALAFASSIAIARR